MEATMVVAQPGHKVILYEKNNGRCGQLLLPAVLPARKSASGFVTTNRLKLRNWE